MNTFCFDFREHEAICNSQCLVCVLLQFSFYCASMFLFVVYYKSHPHMSSWFLDTKDFTISLILKVTKEHTSS